MSARFLNEFQKSLGHFYDFRAKQYISREFHGKATAMAKTRPFSIYLLKRDYNAENCLRDDHRLEVAENSDNLPNGAVLYILDNDRSRPWWRGYFGIKEDIWQETKGALVLLPVGERWFALSFGSVFHHLKDISYEYDFGLRVTLNSLDPKALKSADMLSPGVALRKRTQVPVSTDLTFLDFDGNSEVIKSLTGKVKEEYAELFKNATGSVSLKVSFKLNPQDIPEKCEQLLQLYDSEDYKEIFPNIQNVAAVKDPEIVATLNEHLIDAFRIKEGTLKLSIPDVVDYRDNTSCLFTGGEEASDIFPDITIKFFYDYVERYADIRTVSIGDLHEYQMLLTDMDGNVHKGYSIYRSLIFDITPPGEEVTYHFCDGSWYKVDQNFARRLKTYLDDKCVQSDLCPYNHDENDDGNRKYSEENYNKSVPEWSDDFVCLDRTDISPAGHTGIEPCDLYRIVGTEENPPVRGVFYHVKISTRSTQLSHLFNQGVNSIEIVKRESEARTKLIELISDKFPEHKQHNYTNPLVQFKFKVVFAIISHADPERRSDNLPLFSKISLMRNMQQLDLYEVPSALMFVADESGGKTGHKKYKLINVEVYAGDRGKPIIRALPGQDVDAAIEINRCSKEVSSSPAGSRWKIGVKATADGRLNSHHSWPIEQQQLEAALAQ